MHKVVELCVTVNEIGDSSIVVIPFISGNSAVFVLVIEVGHELKEYLFF